MKPHPRIRKTVKWGGVALTVLLVGVWVGSGRRDVAYWFGSFGSGWSLWHGQLLVMHTGGAITVTPISLIVIITGFPTTVAWWLDTIARRRAGVHLCHVCGYDRTGLVGGPSAPCPECGSPAPATRA